MSESTLETSSRPNPPGRGAAATLAPLRTRGQEVLRWLGRVAAVLVALVVLAVGTVYGVSERRMRTRAAVPEHPIAVSQDALTIARGEHVATVRGCVDCHGAGFIGNTILDQPIIGRVAGPNLTLGGRGAELEPGDWERAVRHGVRRDGTPLVFMPSGEFTVLTDEDLAAVIAYARSLPPVRHVAPSTYAGPLLRTMYVTGKVKILSPEGITHERAHDRTLVAEPTAAYGKYLASGCTGCHGA